MPVLRKCKFCKKPFKTKLSHIKNGWGKYCGAECHHKSLKTGKVVKCFTCGKDTYKTLKALRVSKSGKWFCSKSCQTAWRNTEFSGSKHANYVNGQFLYRNLLAKSNIPKKCKLCGVTDMRILAAHHVDENRENNRLENLTWLCHNCHHLVHRYKVEKQRFLAEMARD